MMSNHCLTQVKNTNASLSSKNSFVGQYIICIHYLRGSLISQSFQSQHSLMLNVV